AERRRHRQWLAGGMALGGAIITAALGAIWEPIALLAGAMLVTLESLLPERPPREASRARRRSDRGEAPAVGTRTDTPVADIDRVAEPGVTAR
ncbi:MAG: hypothetical protein MUF21_11440, partial [Gemmatimonadaceae bacterium]|nr:hypothetical protein [Gemmatimonadaceae bacterium]